MCFWKIEFRAEGFLEGSFKIDSLEDFLELVQIAASSFNGLFTKPFYGFKEVLRIQ